MKMPINLFVKAYRQSLGMGQDEFARRCHIRPLNIYVKWELGQIHSDEYAIKAMSELPEDLRADPILNGAIEFKAVAIRLMLGNSIFNGGVDGIGIKLNRYLRCVGGYAPWSSDAKKRIERVFERMMK